MQFSIFLFEIRLRRLQREINKVLSFSGLSLFCSSSIDCLKDGSRSLVTHFGGQGKVKQLSMRYWLRFKSLFRIDPQIYNAASFILQPHTVRQFREEEEEIHHS